MIRLVRFLCCVRAGHGAGGGRARFACADPGARRRRRALRAPGDPQRERDRRDRCADAGPVRRGGRARPDRGDRADRRPGGDRAVAAGRGGDRDRWHRLHPDARVRRHHVHLHTLDDGQGVPPEYVLAVDGAWRDQRARAGQWPPDRVAGRRQAAQRAQRIVAPRIDVYPFFNAIQPGINDADTARQAVRNARAAAPTASSSSARSRRTCSTPPWTRPRRSACAPRCTTPSSWWRTPTCCRPRRAASTRWSTGTACLEAMFTDRRLQRWPAEFNNTDEQMRFAEAGRLWEQAAEPGSPRWNEVMETLLERGFGLSRPSPPTWPAAIPDAHDQRHLARAVHDAGAGDFYRPSRLHHGSCWFDWTTEFRDGLEAQLLGSGCSS